MASLTTHKNIKLVLAFVFNSKYLKHSGIHCALFHYLWQVHDFIYINQLYVLNTQLSETMPIFNLKRSAVPEWVFSSSMGKKNLGPFPFPAPTITRNRKDCLFLCFFTLIHVLSQEEERPPIRGAELEYESLKVNLRSSSLFSSENITTNYMCWHSTLHQLCSFWILAKKNRIKITQEVFYCKIAFFFFFWGIECMIGASCSLQVNLSKDRVINVALYSRHVI